MILQMVFVYEKYNNVSMIYDPNLHCLVPFHPFQNKTKKKGMSMEQHLSFKQTYVHTYQVTRGGGRNVKLSTCGGGFENVPVIVIVAVAEAAP